MLIFNTRCIDLSLKETQSWRGGSDRRYILWRPKRVDSNLLNLHQKVASDLAAENQTLYTHAHRVVWNAVQTQSSVACVDCGRIVLVQISTKTTSITGPTQPLTSSAKDVRARPSTEFTT